MVGPGVPGQHGGLIQAEACPVWGRRFHPPQGLLLLWKVGQIRPISQGGSEGELGRPADGEALMRVQALS